MAVKMSLTGIRLTSPRHNQDISRSRPFRSGGMGRQYAQVGVPGIRFSSCVSGEQHETPDRVQARVQDLRMRRDPGSRPACFAARARPR